MQTELALCPGCLETFWASHPNQRYCSDACSNRARQSKHRKEHPQNSMTKPFVAWDGEGENGKYTLLANSLGKSITDREGLSTARCLDFLLHKGKWDGINVWFSFGYDIAMILHDIPVVAPQGEPSLLELHTKGTLKWHGYTMTYFPKKKFIVHRGSYEFVSYDVFSFFQTKFVNVIRDWAMEKNEELPPLLTEGKAGREDFASWSMEKIAAYNGLECGLLVTAMDKFRQALDAAGLQLKSWHGPGALASVWLENHGIKQHIAPVPEDMYSAVMRAYFGGRIEIAGWGHVDHIWHYDINSAYPRALCDVLSLKDIDWQLRAGMPPDGENFALCHVRWNCKGLKAPKPYLWGPLPYRQKDGSILYPPQGEGWYWGVEAYAAMRRFPGEVEILEHWYPEGERIYPFREPVMHDAALRLRWKAEGFPGHVPLKLVLNSLYGKLAQKIGYWRDGKYNPPPFQCHAWAGYVTAFTRAMIADALHKAHNRAICVMTDSVWSLEPLDLDLGKGLGQWSFEEEDKAADFCGAGLYQAYDVEGRVRDKEYKSRGFSLDQGDKLDYTALIADWKRSLDEGDFSDSGRTYEIRRFIGIGQAVRQPKYRPYFGHFIDITRNLSNLAMQGQTKRLGAVVARSVVKDGIHWLLPVPVGIGAISMFDETPMSAPYRAGKTEAEAGEEAMEILAAREDEPD